MKCFSISFFAPLLLARSAAARLIAISTAILDSLVGAIARPVSAIGQIYTDPIMIEFLAARADRRSVSQAATGGPKQRWRHRPDVRARPVHRLVSCKRAALDRVPGSRPHSA